MLTATESTIIHRHEFNHGDTFYRVQWKELPKNQIGHIQHEITVFKLLQTQTEMWSAVSEPVLIQKWKPTVKRSSKYLRHYL